MSVERSRPLTGLAGVAGGYAPLDSGLLVPRSYLPQIAGLLHNMSSATDPGVGDDSGDGYGIGSRWLNTTGDREWVCLDASVGAAVWCRTTIGAWQSFTPTWEGSVSNPAIVNGTLAGRYRYIDATTILLRITMDAGSSTTYGSGNYLFGGFPFTSAARQAINGLVYDSSASNHYALVGRVENGDTGISRSGTNANILSAVSPITFAQGDRIIYQGWLEVT